MSKSQMRQESKTTQKDIKGKKKYPGYKRYSGYERYGSVNTIYATIWRHIHGLVMAYTYATSDVIYMGY